MPSNTAAPNAKADFLWLTASYMLHANMTSPSGSLRWKCWRRLMLIQHRDSCCCRFLCRRSWAAKLTLGPQPSLTPLHPPPASVQTLAPLSQDSVFAGGYGWSMFSPTPELQAVFEGQSGTSFKVLLANSHGECSIQTICITTCWTCSCFHEWVEAAVLGVDAKQELVPSGKVYSSCSSTLNPGVMTIDSSHLGMTSGDHEVTHISNYTLGFLALWL